jgi:Protein of unknown function (DUF2938)
VSIQSIDVGAGILVGLGATLVMDIWTLFLRHAFRVESLSFCLVGRWLRHMPAGTFIHASIGAAPRKSAECALGWAAHYLIGIVFALTLVFSTSGKWLDHPSLMPALLVGVCTVLFPLLVMQPSFGLGIAAAKTPHPTQARVKSLMTHAVFGVGLYASALTLSHFMQASA